MRDNYCDSGNEEGGKEVGDVLVCVTWRDGQWRLGGRGEKEVGGATKEGKEKREKGKSAERKGDFFPL